MHAGLIYVVTACIPLLAIGATILTVFLIITKIKKGSFSIVVLVYFKLSWSITIESPTNQQTRQHSIQYSETEVSVCKIHYPYYC